MRWKTFTLLYRKFTPDSNAKFYGNRLGLDMTKTFKVFFGSQCIYNFVYRIWVKRTTILKICGKFHNKINSFLKDCTFECYTF